MTTLIDQEIAGLKARLSRIDSVLSYVTGHNSGDMLKSVYDTDGNGVVDNSEKVGGFWPTDLVMNTDYTKTKKLFVNVLDYGAVGDWNGVTGTDNLPAFNAAVADVVDGGFLIIPCDGNGSDYWLSNQWVIDKEHITVVIYPGATVRTGSTHTTNGFTIGFNGYWGIEDPLTYTGNQRGYACITGGGTIINGDTQQWDNAVGFSKYKVARCLGMNIPQCGRKAITAQFHVDNVEFTDNVMGTTGYMAITVETACKVIKVHHNHVASSGDVGIMVTSDGTGTQPMEDVYITENIVDDAVKQSIYLFDFKRAHILDNICKSAGDIAMVVSTGDVLTFRGNHSFDSAKQAFSINAVTTRVNCNGNEAINPSTGNVGTYNAIDINSSPCNPRVIGNSVKGTYHAYALNCSSLAAGKEAICIGNVFDKGTQTSAYGGWQPQIILDSVNGVPVKV